MISPLCLRQEKNHQALLRSGVRTSIRLRPPAPRRSGDALEKLGGERFEGLVGGIRSATVSRFQGHQPRGLVQYVLCKKKLRDEAEVLDPKLVAGGRWAFRKDEKAQEELTCIADGAGLADTIQDLRDLVDFWSTRKDKLTSTDITEKDLARATVLANDLDAAVAKEASNVDAARAIDLRNRSFWASDELASEIREGGRYAFRGEPKIAAKFVSRYRAAAMKRARRKIKVAKAAPAPVG